MYDAIVIGARCGGSPTAMLLARKGYRVLLVDRAMFPSDIVRNHFVRLPAVRYLREWGLLERVLATNCPLVTKYVFDWGDFPLSGQPPMPDGLPGEMGPRRYILDTILVEAAAQAGAEMREGFAVHELLMDGERVSGIRGQTSSGQPVSERARIVIGADGQHSLVARSMKVPSYNEEAARTFGYYTYWSNTAIDGLTAIFPADEDLYIIAFPTNDGLACVAVCWSTPQLERVRADREASYLKALQHMPYFYEWIRDGRQEERLVGRVDMVNFFRKPYGEGWALVGDAGYHKDPALAQGISDAFRDADLLAQAVDSGLSGKQPMHEALAQYERKRNEDALPKYKANLEAVSFEPMPEDVLALRAAIRGNQAEIDRYLGATTTGAIPAEEYFAPENLQRIFAASAAD